MPNTPFGMRRLLHCFTLRGSERGGRRNEMQDRTAEQRRDALAERIFQNSVGVLEILSIYVGDRLGLYRALADGGELTAYELAAVTDTHERYAREWLEQQAVSGLLEVQDGHVEPEGRRYWLPDAHAEVLLERDSLYYMTPLAQQLVGTARPLPTILEAFRSGGGVPYAEYGEDMREGIAYANRAMFVNLMGRFAEKSPRMLGPRTPALRR
jgi:hypothetical protein